MLNENLKAIRKSKGLSQEELAVKLNVVRQTISKWETNKAVPDLANLIKLGELFAISMDTLLLGGQGRAPEQALPGPAACPKSQERPGGKQRTLGLVLLSLGGMVWLLAILSGIFLGGLILAIPFFVCGAICLCFRENRGLWCGWALFFLANVYLRFATGITWRLALWAFQFTASMNFMRLAFAWAELLGFLVLFAVTFFRFWRRPLAATGRNLGLLLGGWALFILLHIPLFPLDSLSFIGNFWYVLGEWCRLILLNVLTITTARLLHSRPRENAGGTSPSARQSS